MRAFVAVEIGENVKAKLAELQKELPPGIKRVEPENMHMTLAFLSDIDDAMAGKVEAALASVYVVPFSVICCGVGVFPSEDFVRVVWAGTGTGEMEVLHDQVGVALAPLGFKPDKFSPHITIGRLKAKADVGAFLQKHAGEDFGTFEVAELKLKKSMLLPKGPVYSDIFVKKLG